MATILVIDDDLFHRELLSDILKKSNHKVLRAKNGLEGLKMFTRYKELSVVVSDVVMPDIDGLVVLSKIKEIQPFMPVILLTGHQDQNMMLKALRLGAFDFQRKPISPVELVMAVDRAICHHRLLREQKNKVERLAVIENGAKRLSDLVAVDMSPESMAREYDLIDSIVKLISEMLDCDRVSIMLLDPEEKKLKVAVAVGMSKNMIKEETRPGAKSVSGYVLENAKSLLVTDITTDERVDESLYSSQYKNKSFIAVPLKAKDSVVGVINANDKKNREEFTEDDLTLLKTVSSHVSSVLSHAVHSAERELNKERQKKTSEFLRILINCLEPEEMLEDLLHKCQQMMGAASVAVFLKREEEQDLTLELGYNGQKKMSAKNTIPMGRSITGMVVANGKDYLCNNPEADPHFESAIEWPWKGKIKNLLVAPLRIGDENIGAIRLLNKKGGDFTDLDLQMLQDLASSLSIAIRNIKLYEELNRSVGEVLTANRTLQELNDALVMRSKELEDLKKSIERART